MARRELSPSEVLAILVATPRQLAELTNGATEAQLGREPMAKEWSAVELLAHLRACADVWGEAIDTILREQRPTLRAVNPTTWIESTDYRDLAFRRSLEAFARQRDKLLSTLGQLSDAQWARRATVAGAGAPLERTVLDYAARLARHERSHWRQLARTVDSVTSRG